MSIARLRSRARPRQRAGGRPMQRQALGRVDRRLRAEHLEQARHDVDLDVELVELADRSRASLVRLLARRRRSRARRRERRRAPAAPPAARGPLRSPSPSAALAGVLVDEADDVDAVLRMLEQLRGDALADVAGADDQRVLDVRVACGGTDARAMRAARATSAIASTQKSSELREARVGETGERTRARRRPRRRR